jgi:tRNA(Ile)-lysidine synthase
VPLHVHRPRRPEGNLQAWARDVRYAEAERLAAGDVAAGHTASDQVETVLYRLAASPGRRALLGMRPREGRVIRPLLGAWRAETEAWCAEHGLPWREDPTNASDAYARNRARHRLVPALRELHPAAEANVLRTLELLRDEAEVLDAAVDAVLDADVAHLRALPPALARLVLVRLAGGAPVGHRADEILALGEHGALDVGGGLRATIERGRVEFVPTPPRVRA